MSAAVARSIVSEARGPLPWRGCGGPDPRILARTLGELVAAIGGAGFPSCFLGVMRALAGVDLCAAFRRDGEAMSLLFAEGEPAQVRGFPRIASSDYALGHWRSDARVARLSCARIAAPMVVRRRACDDPAGIAERVALLWPGRPGVVVNGYRMATSAPFAIDDVARLELHAGLLIAALTQHLRVDAATGHPFNQAALVETLMALDCKLSAREAEVAAALGTNTVTAQLHGPVAHSGFKRLL